MTASYGEVSVDESNTNTKLNINAFLSYLLSSIHFGQPMNLQPATSLKAHTCNNWFYIAETNFSALEANHADINVIPPARCTSMQ